MDAGELIRWVDSISRDRGLSKEDIISDIERALIQAANKRFDQEGEFSLSIDHETGEIRAYEDDRPVELGELGRIVANVAKQVLMQSLKERERDIIYDEWIKREHTIVSGTILREERRIVVINLGRTEAILPREEQIPGEVYRPGAVIRAYVHSVSKKGQRVRIVLSRTHSNFVRELFIQEIPEIADGLIEIKGIVREAGRRTKIAVESNDPRIDPVGSCVGMRGARITKITDELGGEKIDIIPFAEDPAQYIENSMKPARIMRISYDPWRERAQVVVSQDQLPLAIGKAGQNVRLSAKLTRYRIDVTSEEQARERRALASAELQRLIETGAIQDYLREVFLDRHLDDLALIAAQSPDRLIEHLPEMGDDLVLGQKLIDQADALLTPEQRERRDEFVQQREEQERRLAEEEAAAALLEAAEAENQEQDQEEAARDL